MSLDLAYLRACAARGPFVRILITRTAGSVPREAGTSMIVWAEGQEGTIGGCGRGPRDAAAGRDRGAELSPWATFGSMLRWVCQRGVRGLCARYS